MNSCGTGFVRLVAACSFGAELRVLLVEAADGSLVLPKVKSAGEASLYLDDILECVPVDRTIVRQDVAVVLVRPPGVRVAVSSYWWVPTGDLRAACDSATYETIKEALTLAGCSTKHWRTRVNPTRWPRGDRSTEAGPRATAANGSD
jgi:hypothetical protein